MNPAQKILLIIGGLALAYVAACELGRVLGWIIDKCLGPADGQEDPRPPAPAVFIGIQEFPGCEPFELYNLTADIAGHPRDSTVSRATLERAGYFLKPLGLGTAAAEQGCLVTRNDEMEPAAVPPLLPKKP